ncbi:hypothetical protein MAPG_01171, partial [Magnaporthiopsis poae ATCC 64411]
MADATFRPALLVVDFQEDFCPPVSLAQLRQPFVWRVCLLLYKREEAREATSDHIELTNAHPPFTEWLARSGARQGHRTRGQPAALGAGPGAPRGDQGLAPTWPHIFCGQPRGQAAVRR